MLRKTTLAATTLCVAASAASPSRAECSQHTFDPCPAPQPAYNIEVDQKTGRTWLKETSPPAGEKSRLARLSAAAKKLPPGSLSKKGAARGGDWRTRVEAENEPPPRSK